MARGEQRGGVDFGIRRFLTNWLSVRMLRQAHKHEAPVRLLLGMIVGLLWIGLGVWASWDHGWRQIFFGAPGGALHTPVDDYVRNFAQGVCIMQSGEECKYFAQDPRIGLSQAAFAVLALLTLLFGFWTQFLSALAHALRAAGKGHVLITGEGAEAEALARDVAMKGRKGRQAAVLARKQASSAEIAALAADGVALIAGPPADPALLRGAGVRAADRIVTMSANENENLAVAAAVAKLRGEPAPGDLLVRIENPRSRRDLTARGVLYSIDAFSLAGIAARDLLLNADFLDLAAAGGHERVHIGIVGWDETALAVAAAVFRLMWAPQFQAPRITVFAQEPAAAEKQFKARYPQAFGNEVWSADIAFQDYDWESHADAWAPLDAGAAARGPFTALVVTWPDDGDTLRCTSVLSRDAGADQARPALFARENPEGTIGLALSSSARPRISSFGALNNVLSAEALVNRSIDAAARLVHDTYFEGVVVTQKNAGAAPSPADLYRRALTRKRGLLGAAVDDPGGATPIAELEQAFAARFGEDRLLRRRAEACRAILAKDLFEPDPARPAQKRWDELAEQYISANRTAADHALVKLWALGWRPAARGQNGRKAALAASEISDALCEVEHKRWSADYLLSGWRYGEARNDALMVHPDLKPYAAFADGERQQAIDKDRNIWLTAPRVAQTMYPRGFVQGAAPRAT